jgi:undecaprenyl-phosphate 4-deoxy-4-formamido-L-arabinose transferase
MSEIPDNTAEVLNLPEGISVVVPVFNSEGSLVELAAQLEAVLRSCARRFDLIMVNDCSRDNSWKVICELVAQHDWVQGINLMRNYGQHNALLCGIRAAAYNKIITIDDDLQNPPGEIPRLLSVLNQGCDVVYGFPDKQQHGLLRNLASEITKLVLQTTMGAQTARRVSAFRAFRTELRAAFSRYQSPLVSIDVLLTWATSRFAAIAVHHENRKIGQSNYTLGKLITHALNMMTGFTVLPLQISSVIGFVFTAFGGCVLLFVLSRYVILGTSVPGFPFLASVIAIFSGVQLFALGVIGEYMARQHMRTMEKPTYAIRGFAVNRAGCEQRVLQAQEHR